MEIRMTEDVQDLITTTTAARLSGYSQTHIRRLINKQLLPCVVIDSVTFVQRSYIEMLQKETIK